MTERLDRIFAALADPTRRAILAMLLEDDMAVTDVAAPLPISLAAVSKHLGVLASAGLISRDRRGRVIWCRLEPDALREAAVWMQAFGQVEPLELDAFERFVAAELEAARAALEAEVDAEDAGAREPAGGGPPDGGSVGPAPGRTNPGEQA